MHTAVVELDSLADTVGTPAQNHHLRPVAADRIFILSVISGKVICTVRSAADMDAFPCLLHAQADTALPDLLLWDI